MQDKLLKYMLAVSIVVSVICMFFMLRFAATKTVVIAEESHGNETEMMQTGRTSHELTFLKTGKNDAGKIVIPLPDDIRADNISIESLYAEHSLNINIDDKLAEFYKENSIQGDNSLIESGSYEESGGKTNLRLQLQNLYDYKYVFEKGMLQFTFLKPKQLHEKVIVLDPAHGGDDSGYTEKNLKEKDITLSVVMKAKEKLEAEGIGVYCTRLDDVGLEEEKRVNMANQMDADLFISVRAAIDRENNSVSGIQTFYNGNYFIPYFGNTQLADSLEREVCMAVRGKANGLFEASTEDSLLMKIQIPAAALEVGYLSNEAEAEKLEQEGYQDKLALGIANAVLNFYKEQDKEK